MSNDAINKFKKHHSEMKNDLVSETTSSIIEGLIGLKDELMGQIDFEDDILKIEFKEDNDVMNEGMKELNAIHKKVPDEFKVKFDKIIKFMKELPNDIFYQITKTYFTYNPINDKYDTKTQLKSLNTHFYIQHYLYSDCIEGQSKKNLFNKIKETSKEINKVIQENVKEDEKDDKQS